MKHILVKRIQQENDYTIGELYVNDEFVCNTIEDCDRGLTDNMSEAQIKSIKVYGKTAIPKGTYKVDLDTISPKFSKYSFYMEVCQGKLPRLVGVKGFNGILLHVADGPRGAELVQGCLGVGENKIKGGLLNGKATFKKLMSILLDNKEDTDITIE